jgi:ABC-type sugar transport system substrate-binding protein
MKKFAAWLLAIVATAFFYTGPKQALSPGYAAAEPIKIGLIFETLGNPVFAEMKQAAVEEAALHPEVQLTVEGGASGMDLAGMVRIAENLMQKKVHVLAFSAIDAKGVIPTIKKAHAAGIPVIMHSDDTDPPMQARHFVGPDQYRVANLEGAWIAKTVGKGKIATLPTSSD